MFIQHGSPWATVATMSRNPDRPGLEFVLLVSTVRNAVPPSVVITYLDNHQRRRPPCDSYSVESLQLVYCSRQFRRLALSVGSVRRGTNLQQGTTLQQG